MALVPENDACGTRMRPEGLDLLSNTELELMQSITLNQMRSEPEQTTLLLLGRVWYRLEHERRRRRDEIVELERMYFARSATPAKRKAAASR